MVPVEKNDVDISKLFSWSKEIDLAIPGKEDTIKVFIRLVGDADLNRARVFGLRESAKFRRSLRDTESDERLAYIPEYDSVTKSQLIDLLVVLDQNDLVSEVVDKIDIPLPPEIKSDASLEEQEKHQQLIDDYASKRESAIRDAINKEVDKHVKRLKELGKQEIYNDYVTRTINQICKMKMLQKFREMSTFFGTFLDADFTTRFVKTFEDFDNLPSEVKAKLISEYIKLEVDSETLKK